MATPAILTHRPSLPAAELRRFARAPRAGLALLAALIVPLVIGGLSTWAQQSPLTRLDQRPAAIVNHDEAITLTKPDGTEQLVLLGRQVVGALTTSTASTNYAWQLTDAATAEAGLTDGRYAAVLTIPADFSRSATSTSGPAVEARAGRLQVRTNDAVNYLDHATASTIATASSEQVARMITEGYLSALYAGYSTLHDQLGDAADGAGALADGAGRVGTGAGSARSGAGELASGMGELAAGAQTWAAGADELAEGARQAAAGARRLADGLAAIDGGTAGLPAQTRQLADGADALADGVTQLASGAKPLAAGARQFQQGATQLTTGLTALATGAQGTATGAARLSTGVTAYTKGISRLAAACPSSGAAVAFCQQLSALAGQGPGLATGAGGVASGTSALATGLDTSQTGASALSQSAGQLADGIGTLASAAERLAPGGTQLAAGLDQLADSAPALSGGIHEAATGAAALADQLPRLGTGSRELAAGADRLAAGALQASGGADQLASGLDKLTSGTAELSSGAAKLSEGLASGVAKIPTYTEAERAQLASVAAQPVLSEASRLNAVHDFGSARAPLLLALGLWAGALAGYLLIRPLSARALASSANSPSVALAGYLPGAVLGLAQAGLAALVLQFAVDIQAASWWAFLGVALLVALTFVAVNQALVALFGAAGRIVAVLLLGIQLAASGATFAIETAPAPLGWLHEALPLGHAVSALRLVIAGSDVGLGRHLALFGLTAVGAVAVSTYAAARRRTFSPRTLQAARAAQHAG